MTDSEGRGPLLGAVYPDDAWVDAEADAVVDEFRHFMPPGVRLMSSATPIRDVGAHLPAGIELAENGDIEESARRLSKYEPDCYAYYCTTVSFVRGVGGDLDISDRITRMTGKPATTTSSAMIRAFKALGISSVTLASPYMPDVESRFIQFIQDHGVRVLNSLALNLAKDHSIVPPERIRQLAESSNVEKSDAVFVGCTGQKLALHLDEMEAALGKPVLTANQVTSWHALQLMGIEPCLEGRGKLFSGGVLTGD